MEAREKIEKSEKMFRAIIENNYDAISLREQNTNIIYQSPAFERVTGYTFEEAQHQHLANILYPEDIPGVISEPSKLGKTPGDTLFGTHKVLHKKWPLCLA